MHSSLEKFKERFKSSGFNFDDTTLLKSRRCSKTTCDFIQNRIGIEIESNENRITECELIENKEKVKEIFEDDNIVKLFLTRHYNYECRSDNWGACKGLGFDNVCIVINDELLKEFKSGGLINFKSNFLKKKMGGKE